MIRPPPSPPLFPSPPLSRSRRRVPYPVRIAHLLAARLRPGVRWIPNRHDDFLFTLRFERAGDVEAESVVAAAMRAEFLAVHPDRKSTRLNSSHSQISYAVFC